MKSARHLLHVLLTVMCGWVITHSRRATDTNLRGWRITQPQEVELATPTETSLSFRSGKMMEVNILDTTATCSVHPFPIVTTFAMRLHLLYFLVYPNLPLVCISLCVTRLLALVDSLHPDNIGVIHELHDGDLGPKKIFLFGFHRVLHDDLHRLPLQGVLVDAPVAPQLHGHIFKAFAHQPLDAKATRQPKRQNRKTTR